MLTSTHKDLLSKLSTTNVSDALDHYHLKGAVHGILPTWNGCKKIFGETVTVRLIAAGTKPPQFHLGQQAIFEAKEGDIIVVDNAGRPDISCWGGVLATGAKIKGVSGVIIDGYCRDIDDYVSLDYSVYARGSVVQSARGRAIEDATNIPIQFGQVQVNPGDVVIADRSGIVFIPNENLDNVLAKAEELYQKEEAMCADLMSGMSNMDVDAKYSYNTMLAK
ncbi:MAG: RraA family protein [Puniceicoccales bacterium]|jgi:regulator of RNase E activity RraA|nr:RraA family protein [Puniceicoccales bacterium]